MRKYAGSRLRDAGRRGLESFIPTNVRCGGLLLLPRGVGVCVLYRVALSICCHGIRLLHVATHGNLHGIHLAPLLALMYKKRGWQNKEIKQIGGGKICAGWCGWGCDVA